MKRSLPISFLALMLLTALPALEMLPVHAHAQKTENSSPIKAEARVTQAEVTVGDAVTYTLRVQHDPEIHLAPPDPTKSFKGFELKDQITAQAPPVNEQTVEEYQFHLRADRVGNYTIPKIKISFTAPEPGNPDRMIPGELFTNTVKIVVRSVLYEDGTPEDIKDLKPILGSGPDWNRYLWIAAAVLAGLALWFAFLKWISPKRKAVSPSAEPEQLAHEIALQSLELLMQKQLIEQGRFREHYFELSEIFRRYLGDLCAIPALDWTTEEIEAFLRSHPGRIGDEKEQVLSLLKRTDRIKFAKAPTDAVNSRHHVDEVRQFIENTQPESQPVVYESNNAL